MTEAKKIVFVPGCFDNFEGTQEELDEFVAMITQMAESGELEELSTELDEEAWADLDDEDREKIGAAFGLGKPRYLN